MASPSATPATAHPAAKIRVPLRHGRLVFTLCKYAIFSALIVDMLIFLIHAPLNEALDSFGWLLLLGAFEYESRSLTQDYIAAWEKYGLMAVQALGYAIAIKVTITYGLTEDWLDLANSCLWLLVCCSLVYDIYAPGDFGRREWILRNAVKVTLYLGLVAVALAWAFERDWLGFIDAVLWILCFAFVELNIVEFEEAETTELAAV